MIMRKVITYVNNSDFPVISLVFTASASIFTLALSSFIQVLEFTPIHQYPVLMLISSLCIFGIEFFAADYLKKFKGAYNVLFFTFIVSLIFNVFTYHPLFTNIVYKPNGYLFSNFIFIGCMTSIVLMRNSLKVILSQTTSKLKNSKLSEDLKIAKNSGTIFAATYMLVMGTTQHYWLTVASAVIPSFASLVMLYYVQQVKNKSDESFENVVRIQDQLDKTTEFNNSNFPFLYLVFSMFFISFFVLSIQQFVTLVGLYELKSQKQISTIVLYSSLAILQTVVGLSLSFGHEFITGRKPRWNLQFSSQFGFSIISFTILFFKTSPITMLLGGTTSSLIHEAFGEDNDKEFYSNIPKFIRSRVKQISNTYVYFAAACFSSLLVYMAMKSSMSMSVMWGLAVFASVAGIFIKFELHKVFSDYHVGQIVRGNIYEAVECCNHLATPDSQNRYGAITSILHQGPRPMLAKALLNVLAKMERPEVVPDLIDYYNISNRDDIKLTALKALVCYESHHINLFLLESLEDIITNDKFSTDTKREIFDVVTSKIHGIAIPMILKILKENATEFRVVANAILSLGSLAEKTKDEQLYFLLSKYTKPIYSRRIRSNACLFLYKHRKYREIANACMSSLLTSSNEYDRNAVAYMAGELKVYTMTPFILETSESYSHTNTTLLISLLKLDYLKATDLICDILQSEDLDLIQGVLSQINMIKDKKYRYRVYDRYLTLYSDKINHLLEQMSLSQKNFDEDRMVIREEAIKMGFYVVADKKLFLKNGQLLKAA